MRHWLIGLVVLLCLPAATAAQEYSYDTEYAFSVPRAAVDSARQAEFNYGRGLFDYHWHPVDAKSGIGRGFGPLFSADSCAACHVRDGRGTPPEAGTAPLAGLILLIGNENGEPDPVYGAQLSDKAIEGAVPEAVVETKWRTSDVVLPDGTAAQLRRPDFALHRLAYGPMAPDSRLAPRLAPPLIGLGLLEAVPADAIVARADPDDADGDGISGRINWLAGEQGPAPGRFGWKATMLGVEQQIQHAAATDMGFTSPLFPDPDFTCTASEGACRAAIVQAALGETPHLDFDRDIVRFLTAYASTLSVPPRHGADAPGAVAGAKLFDSVGCAACHTPSLPTGDGETIRPYTDLLLHDMGPDLADGLPMGMAGPGEWRTPPLWGIGRTEQVSGATFFLHDGRARSLFEAILWHGGEAEAARRSFVALAAAQRQKLLAFLQSL